jgi:protein TonB
MGEPTDPDARSQAVEDIIERLQKMMENPVETKQPEPVPKPEQAPAPQPAAPPAQPAGKPGVQSDQESDATSLEVTMEQLTLGRPLAAQGLQLKPRKPVFTTLTLLTAVPANPLAELRFRRDGKPVRVRLLESSGDPRIDEAVLNSLYRWRAAGKQLRELDAQGTIPIRIRIMLRPS